MIWMTPRRFAWALRARGPGLAEWPARERMGALCLLRRNAEARELLVEALAAEDAPAPNAVLLDRVICPVRRALAPLTPAMRGLRWGALAGCIVAGLAIGTLAADLVPAAAEIAGNDLLPVMHPTMPATVLAALDP